MPENDLTLLFNFCVDFAQYLKNKQTPNHLKEVKAVFKGFPIKSYTYTLLFILLCFNTFCMHLYAQTHLLNLTNMKIIITAFIEMLHLE